MSEKIRLIAFTEALLAGATQIRKMMLGIAIVAISAVPALAVCTLADQTGCHKVDDPAIFELEQNANLLNDAASAGPDWNSASPNKHIADGAGASIFTQGGSKDLNGIGQWRWTAGSVPDKDDIQNGYAYAATPENQLMVYFAADRTSNNGDANIGFWFFQDAVTQKSDGTFNGKHQNGDIFVVSGFTSGGSTSVITIFKWVCANALTCDSTGSLVQQTTGTAVQCVGTGSGTKTACASSNTTATAAINTYVPKVSGFSSGTYPPATFFEGGVNLGALGISLDTCFASFMVETRSSTSANAQLKDFTINGFESCGISITKVCTNGVLGPNGTFKYNVYGTVTNTGSGTLPSVVVTDTVDGVDHVTGNLGPLGPGSRNWPGGAYDPSDTTTFFLVTSSTNGPSNTATVAAQTGAGTTLSGEVTVGCDPVATNPSLTVGKSCTVDLTSNGGALSVVVNFSGQVCNTGDVPLTNVSVQDFVGGVANGSSIAVANLAPGSGPNADVANSCKTYSSSYLPSAATATVVNGRYRFDDSVTATATPGTGTCGANATCTSGSGVKSCYLCEQGQCVAPAP